MTSKRPRTPCRLSEMEPRGWTGDLVRIHLPAHHAWYPSDLVHQVEQTDAWQDDLAYAQMGGQLICTRKDLAARGWSAGMITSLLGDPDYIDEWQGYGTRQVFRYLGRRVDLAEATPAFEKRREQARRHREAGLRGAEGKRARELERLAVVSTEVIAKVDRLTVRMDAPSYAALEARALKAQQRWYDQGLHGSSVHGADRDTVDRWCENYVRHHCVRYESLLHEVAAAYSDLPAKDRLALYEETIRPRVDALVRRAIADLKAADVSRADV